MGYMHIDNLYKNQRILMFRRCYAMEKVHGTSAHVKWKDGAVTLFSGGEPMIRFAKLFDLEALAAKFQELGCPEVTVYGEAYGGSQQGMSDTYGPDLRFIVFDVQMVDRWLKVPDMDGVARQLGFEVVPWEETSTDLASLDAIRDKPSEVAVRRGVTEPKLREGVVLRPLEEMTINNDQRVICKHKGDAFTERAKQPRVQDTRGKLEVIAEANAIANEWVTEERLSHVLGHFKADGNELKIENTGKIIEAMVEDVYREAKGEIVESKEARGAICRKTGQMFRQRIQDQLAVAAAQAQP